MKQVILKGTTVLISISCLSWLSSCNTSKQEDHNFTLTQTGQTNSYDIEGNILTNLKSGDALYGQDADYKKGTPMSYTDNKNGTITDNVTGLMWGQEQSEKAMTWEEAKQYCEDLSLAGYDDWRLPSLKELWSIRDFSAGWPYVNVNYFHFTGDGSQGRYQHTWSSNAYTVDTEFAVKNTAFATNDWTGHIKCFEGARYVRPVRGKIYGENDFIDNGDNTVTDKATGLMWTKNDFPKNMTWKEALSYADTATIAGYDDWRVPNVKELQSIVDYSGVFPAIDTTYFNITPFEHSNGVPDYPFFWTSTSAYFGVNRPTYTNAWYVAFGYGVGKSGNDLHGAGSVRFLAKDENAIQEEEGHNDPGQKRHDEGTPHGSDSNGRSPQGPPPNGENSDEARPPGPPPHESDTDETRPPGPPPHEQGSAESREFLSKNDSTQVQGTYEMHTVRLVRDNN